MITTICKNKQFHNQLKQILAQMKFQISNPYGTDETNNLHQHHAPEGSSQPNRGPWRLPSAAVSQ